MKLKHSQLANLPDGKHPDGAGLYFRVWCSGTACLAYCVEDDVINLAFDRMEAHFGL